jgi:uncharacterized protein
MTIPRNSTALAVGLVLVASVAALWWWSRPAPETPVSPSVTELDEPAATETWRETRATNLQAPDGWLSVAGLFFPSPGRNRVGTDPASEIRLPEGAGLPLAGHVMSDDGRLWLGLEPGVEGTLEGEPVRGRVELRPADPATERPADRVRIGRVTLQVHRSGERLGIRLRDPESPIRTGFTGLDWYPIDPTWRVQGRFAAYPETRTIKILNVVGDLVDEPSPGEVAFEAQGQSFRLVALDAGTRMWFVFRDATAGDETYNTRFLYADKADARGVVTLDFNRAYNPPCAYNPHTTCPLPPPENVLPIPIPAGEKLYRRRTS